MMTETNDNGNARKGGRSATHKWLWSLIVVGGVIGIGSVAYVGHAVADGDGWHKAGMMHGGGYGKGHGGRHGGGAAMLRLLDADGDGEISRAELEEGAFSRLQANDANGDGALSVDEFQAVWAEMTRSRMVDAFQHVDEDGDGSMTRAEIQAQLDMMMRRMDRNEDGKLSPDDRRGGWGHHRDQDDDRG